MPFHLHPTSGRQFREMAGRCNGRIVGVFLGYYWPAPSVFLHGALNFRARRAVGHCVRGGHGGPARGAWSRNGAGQRGAPSRQLSRAVSTGAFFGPFNAPALPFSARPASASPLPHYSPASRAPEPAPALADVLPSAPVRAPAQVAASRPPARGGCSWPSR